MSSANQPSDSGKKAAGRLMDFAARQYLREDGTFLDIPADILPNPPTKPIQFLHLEHYFMAPSGLKKDLGECAGPEEAVDILANELAAMQLLLRGYFTHLERYVAKFDGQHEELQKEILSLGESYMGLRMLAQPACAQSKAVSADFDALEQKVKEVLTNATVYRAPPKIVRSDDGPGLKNPELTKAENAQNKARRAARTDDIENASAVGFGQNNLEERAQLSELMRPPTLSPTPSGSGDDKTNKKKRTATDKGKGKSKAKETLPAPAPPNARVAMKIEKLTEGLNAMRAAFWKAHGRTQKDLLHLRNLSQQDKRAIDELWAFHDTTQGSAFTAGRIAKSTLRRVEAYDRWATECLEEQARVAELSAVEFTSSSSPTQNPDADASRSSSQGTSAPADTNDEVYAVTLDLECDKQLDELTRDEAIAMLKSLPMRVHFNPRGPLPPAVEVEENPACAQAAPTPTPTNVTTVDNAAVPTASGMRPAPAEAETSAQSASGAGQPEPPAAKKSEGKAKAPASSQPQGRKRGRSSEDAGAKDSEDVRAAAGGSPVKKMRLRA